ncbi:MAG TPA: pilus assembly protein TadG-related protein, partial [Rhizomicrobium sp.]|nr:pilus assembly protein TadG-related protein [Rhizomicrobium sp.]
MGVVIMLRLAGLRIRAFPKAVRGNIAMIFGLSLIPICVAAGVGLDMSRAMITRARMGAALDAAGLAIGSKPGMTQDEMTALANQYFMQNYTADAHVYGQPAKVVVNRPDGAQTITLSTSVEMPTTLMRVVGLDTMGVAANSQITWGQTKLWVSLVLDNTGSMCGPPSNASFPCPNPADTTKIYALQQATHNLLNMLKDAAANNGDVLVSIVPFSKDVTVGTSYAGADWIDWTDWESAPPNVTIAGSVGPGSNCPFTDSSNNRKSPYGYYCMSNSSSDLGDSSAATKVSKVPASGLICPGVDNGNYNKPSNGGFARAGHYWNGCYDSVPTRTFVSTSKRTTTQTDKSACTQVGSGTISCTPQSSSTSSPSTATSTATQSGYSGDSVTVGDPVVGTPSQSDGNKDCNTKRGVTTCTWTRTVKTDTSTSTVTNTGVGPYDHSWIV